MFQMKSIYSCQKLWQTFFCCFFAFKWCSKKVMYSKSQVPGKSLTMKCVTAAVNDRQTYMMGAQRCIDGSDCVLATAYKSSKDMLTALTTNFAAWARELNDLKCLLIVVNQCQTQEVKMCIDMSELVLASAHEDCQNVLNSLATRFCCMSQKPRVLSG